MGGKYGQQKKERVYTVERILKQHTRIQKNSIKGKKKKEEGSPNVKAKREQIVSQTRFSSGRHNKTRQEKMLCTDHFK